MWLSWCCFVSEKSPQIISICWPCCVDSSIMFEILLCYCDTLVQCCERVIMELAFNCVIRWWQSSIVCRGGGGIKLYFSLITCTEYWGCFAKKTFKLMGKSSQYFFYVSPYPIISRVAPPPPPPVAWMKYYLCSHHAL